MNSEPEDTAVARFKRDLIAAYYLIYATLILVSIGVGLALLIAAVLFWPLFVAGALSLTDVQIGGVLMSYWFFGSSIPLVYTRYFS